MMQRRLWVALAACLSVLALAVAPGGAAPQKATVQKVQGEVTAMVDGGFYTLEKGHLLPPGAEVRTGTQGSVILSWPTGHVFKIGPLSTMTLAAADVSDERNHTRIRLKSGQLFVAAAELVGENDSLEVETPDVLAGVRGTFFSVDRLPAGSEVAVLEGQVSVTAQGVEQLVGPGLQVAVSPGVAPPEPTPVPQPKLQQLQQQRSETGTHRPLPGQLKGDVQLTPEQRQHLKEKIRTTVKDKVSPELLEQFGEDVVKEQIKQELIDKVKENKGGVTFKVE